MGGNGIFLAVEQKKAPVKPGQLGRKVSVLSEILLPTVLPASTPIVYDHLIHGDAPFCHRRICGGALESGRLVKDNHSLQTT